MKKIISIILISMLLITGNYVFAEETTPSTVRNKATKAVDNYKARLSEIKPLLEQIRTNHTEILKLKAEVRNAFNKAKNKIKELKQNKDTISPEQIESIKNSLKSIRQDKHNLGDTIGDIKDEMQNLKAAKNARNIDDAKKALNNIINVQNTRIQSLKTIIENLNKIISL